jgi:hypothetical protein
MKKFFDSENRDSQLEQRVEQKFIWQSLTQEQLSKWKRLRNASTDAEGGYSLSLRNRVALGHKHEHVWRTHYLTLLNWAGDPVIYLFLDDDQFAEFHGEDFVISNTEVCTLKLFLRSKFHVCD